MHVHPVHPCFQHPWLLILSMVYVNTSFVQKCQKLKIIFYLDDYQKVLATWALYSPSKTLKFNSQKTNFQLKFILFLISKVESMMKLSQEGWGMVAFLYCDIPDPIILIFSCLVNLQSHYKTFYLNAQTVIAVFVWLIMIFPSHKKRVFGETTLSKP